ncbi:curli-like amyloid fiber formation chaperone CsgH [Aureimonas glaciei]|uniref:Uncharacterized protein n=1 Tax=Aureimonas glaciei TaxID=1776957 RepID=A0A916XSY2_9HYPH|nr:curli-like amyloid fiber formation chaperone CsgH [Aureimonas glaciei]GGD04926.1 hypothetical protein GCM10011335_04690 [Aureimonas glaciei]
MSKILLLSLMLSAAIFPSEASTNGIAGLALDPRITGCGVTISGGGMAVLRPFIETSSDLSGTFQVVMTKRSSGGTSAIRQSNRFKGGSLGDVQLAVDRPSSLTLRVSITEEGGAPLCSIDAEIAI